MASFWRLIKYLKNYKLLVSLSIISNILLALFTVISIPALIPFFEILFGSSGQVKEGMIPEESLNIGNSLDYLEYYFRNLVIENGKERSLLIACVVMVIIFFFKNLFRYLALFFMAPVRTGVIRDMRSGLYNRFLSLPLSFFSEEKTGDLISRSTADVQEVEWSILNVIEAIFREPLIILGALAFMLMTSVQLTGFVFILLIFTAFIIGGIAKSLKKKSRKAQNLLGVLISKLEETLSGIRIIKGYTSQRFFTKNYNSINDQYKATITRILWRRDLSSPLSEFLSILVVVVLLWYGSGLVFEGSFSGSKFLMFLYAFFTMISPAKSFSKAYYNLQKGLAAIERIEEVLLSEEEIKDPEKEVGKLEFRDEISLENVSFRYKGSGVSTLENLNLKIKKGEVIALVGASGAGKSTLVDLIPRFHDIEGGEIKIDGVNIKEYTKENLRSLMGIVSQQAVLFNDSFKNNIALGMDNLDLNMIVQAAKDAYAHEFIIQTEYQYESNIGDKGVKLSGGQKQRISLARALLRDPEIFILDEATSALDTESEKYIQNALERIMKNKTAIIIAHRLSTIRNADRIIVLEDGKIVEMGTHDQLLKLNGTYANFVNLQAF